MLEDSRQWQEMQASLSKIRDPQRRLSWVVIVACGDMLPAWFYMLGRYDYLSMHAFFYPVPIALAVRVADWVAYWWNWLRSRRGLATSHAYFMGYHDAVEECARVFRATLDREARLAREKLDP